MESGTSSAKLQWSLITPQAVRLTERVRGLSQAQCFLAQLPVETNREDGDGASILIKRRIGHMLIIQACEKPGKETGTVEAFPNVFRTVLQAAVSEQEIMATHSQ